MTEKGDITEIIKGNPELQIELLKDMLDDVRKDRKRKHTLIVLLVILLFSAFVYYEWSFKAFMSQYDYSNTITTTTETNTTNDNKVYDKNSNINASINDIKVNANAPEK